MKRRKDNNVHIVQSRVRNELLKIGQARQSLENVARVIFEIIEADPTLEQILSIFRAEGFMSKENAIISVAHSVLTGTAKGMSQLSAEDKKKLRAFASGGLPPLPASKFLRAESFCIEGGKISMAPGLQGKIEEASTVKIDRKTQEKIEWCHRYAALMNSNPGVLWRGNRKSIPVFCVADGDKMVVDLDLFFNQ